MPLTEQMPKPMIEFGGSTLIERGIVKLRPAIPNIHITVGYKGAMLAQHVIGLGVSSVFNTEGHGNAWWIFNTLLKYLNQPVLVLTADNVTELDFDLLYKEYKRLSEPACMVVPVEPIDGLVGDFIHHKNNVVNELSRSKPSPIYCSGIQMLNPDKINRLVRESDDFYKVWGQLIQLNELKCSDVYPKNWFTVDTPEQLDLLRKRTI